MNNKKEYNAEYWIKNKDRISAQRKEHYKKHREEILERNKKWITNNRDKWNAYQREYRAKLKLDKEKKV